jgi:formamidopyrimidine-DNA glycosylase
MPELAEVEHSRRQWDPGIGHRVVDVTIQRPNLRIFRESDPGVICQRLPGETLLGSEASGKQMLFRFSGDLWLGIHLGMNGELRREEKPDYVLRKHDCFVLRQDARALAFEDKRFFGRVRFHQGKEPPVWWSQLAPGVLSKAFTLKAMQAFLQRRRRTPIKAVLLMQEQFPGIGNWMADEVLWRAGIHPSTKAGDFDEKTGDRLWRTLRHVSRTAIRIVDDDWRYPATWLFAHRWEDGGRCPRCREDLLRATIGGRTTCWCPRCQLAGAE